MPHAARRRKMGDDRPGDFFRHSTPRRKREKERTKAKAKVEEEKKAPKLRVRDSPKRAAPLTATVTQPHANLERKTFPKRARGN